MNAAADPHGHLTWFRNASPYIAAHRGRTFVVAFGGEAAAEPGFPALVHDLTLLARLGIRLVLVHGARPQIDARLHAAGHDAQYHKGLRVTDTATLPMVCEATGRVRQEIEALLSAGLPNTPMAGAGIRVVGGNFIIARPLGVHDGIDYQHTGLVRRVDVAGMNAALDHGDIVLQSTLGVSPTGEIFNLHAEDIATRTAIALHADKLLFLMEHEGVRDGAGRLIRELDPTAATRWLEADGSDDVEAARHLESAVTAVRRGVRRAHLIARSDGALLAELFTRDGAGTLVTAEVYEGLRTARIEDVGGILELIEPLEAEGSLVRRSREQIELEAGNFTVIERDGTIIGCAALYPLSDGISAELACMAIHGDYRGSGRGHQLLDWIETRAHDQGIERLFVLSTQTMHWFRERGYEPGEVDDLPAARQELYNCQRNSKVFVKAL
jgi:amino-acid N-acetyltransferase